MILLGIQGKGTCANHLAVRSSRRGNGVNAGGALFTITVSSTSFASAQPDNPKPDCLHMSGSLVHGQQGKPALVRSMPELCSFFPMYQDFRVRKSSRLVLDMSHVQRIDAVGLAIFLANLLHAISGHQFPSVRLIEPRGESIGKRMSNLGLHAFLGRNNLAVQQMELWDTSSFGSDLLPSSSQCLIEIENECTESGREERLRYVKTKLKHFFKENGGWSINQSQILLILTEMVKNTLDHTGHGALLGLVIERREGRPYHLAFAYCEQGDGLSKTLRKKVAEIPELRTRGPKGSFADLIHWALSPGNSTKLGNGVNHGIGLTMITEGARALGMTLCMIDAQSLVSLDQLPGGASHRTLRSSMSKVSRQGCFTYTGSKFYD